LYLSQKWFEFQHSQSQRIKRVSKYWICVCIFNCNGYTMRCT